MNTLSIYQNKKLELEKKTAKAISNCLKENLDNPVLFLVSGGSVLKVLDHTDPIVLGKNLIISVLDERLGTLPEASNFLELTKTQFYKEAQVCGVKFVPIDEWPKLLSGRVVITLMGIGLDGHTAGIMPFPEDPNKFSELFEPPLGGETAKWVVGYDAGKKNQYPHRLTATISFLKNKIDYAFVYVSGENKKDILKKVLNSKNLAEYPASVIHSMKSVGLYTDLTTEI